MKALSALLIVLSLSVAGCGGSGGTTVQGTVSFTDGGPLPKGVLTATGKTGSYHGDISSDGKYTLEGVVPGTYTVVISGAIEGEADLEMNYDKDGNFVESTAPAPKPLIRAEYGNAADSSLTITVPGEYDLKVEKAD